MGKQAQRAVDLLVPSKLLDTDSQLLLALESESDVLQDISDSFVPLMKRFQIAFFWEQKKSDFKVTWGYVCLRRSYLTEDSAIDASVTARSSLNIQLRPSWTVQNVQAWLMIIGTCANLLRETRLAIS
jgi:hypothetical protein